MFRRVVVPLDGSLLAEQALAPACQIAGRFGGEVLLLRVVTHERSLPGLSPFVIRADSAPAAAARSLIDEAEAYLGGLSLPTPDVPITRRVLNGAPPEIIIAAAAEWGADLIVMSTHGRAGLMRLLYGSVAEAVLRGTTVPVLLVPSRVTVRSTDISRDGVSVDVGHPLSI